MKETIMLQIIVDGKTYTYPKGTPYRVIAADFQKEFPYDILLVNRSGKLCELHKKLDRNCTLEFLTAADKPGMQTYERSTVLLLLKSFRDVVGRDQVERIVVEFTLSHALFLRAISPWMRRSFPRWKRGCTSSSWPRCPSRSARWIPTTPWPTFSRPVC